MFITDRIEPVSTGFERPAWPLSRIFRRRGTAQCSSLDDPSSNKNAKKYFGWAQAQSGKGDVPNLSLSLSSDVVTKVHKIFMDWQWFVKSISWLWSVIWSVKVWASKIDESPQIKILPLPILHNRTTYGVGQCLRYHCSY